MLEEYIKLVLEEKNRSDGRFEYRAIGIVGRPFTEPSWVCDREIKHSNSTVLFRRIIEPVESGYLLYSKRPPYNMPKDHDISLNFAEARRISRTLAKYEAEKLADDRLELYDLTTPFNIDKLYIIGKPKTPDMGTSDGWKYSLFVRETKDKVSRHLLSVEVKKEREKSNRYSVYWKIDPNCVLEGKKEASYKVPGKADDTARKLLRNRLRELEKEIKIECKDFKLRFHLEDRIGLYEHRGPVITVSHSELEKEPNFSDSRH